MDEEPILNTSPLTEPTTPPISREAAFNVWSNSLGGNVEGIQTKLPAQDYYREPASNTTPGNLSLFEKAARINDSGNIKDTAQSVYSTKDINFKRFDEGFKIGIDNEERYANNQSFGEKAYNGVVKMSGIAAATFINGTAGLVYGIGEAAKTGEFSSMYNNNLSNELNQWTESLEDTYAHYKTQREINGHWWEPSNLFTANFFFDNIVKNLGYSIGAVASGAVWGGALSSLGVTARLTGTGTKYASAAEQVLADSTALPKIERAAYIAERLNELKISAGKALLKTDRTIVATTGTFGEAGMEALNNSKQYREAAIVSFTKAHGYTPDAEDMKQIDQDAEAVGKASFWLNTALLSATNYVQLPKIYSSSFKAEKSLLNGVVREGEDYISSLPSKGFGKLLYKTKNLASLGFNTAEAFEEGAQYAIQTGTQNYYKRKYEGEDPTVLDDGILYGIKEALTTDEGLLNVFTGGFSGALQSSGIVGVKKNESGVYTPTVFSTGKIGERGFTGYGGKRQVERESAIADLNNTKIKTKLRDAFESLKAAESIQQDREAAIRQGDILESKDLEFDYAHNFIEQRLKHNAKQFINDEINDLKTQASSNEGFSILREQGIVPDTDTKATFLARLDNLQKHADHSFELKEAIDLKFGGLVDTKTGKKIYSDEVIEQMVYAGSKVMDYDVRIPQLQLVLTQANVISTIDILSDILIDGSPKEEVVAKAVEEINKSDVLNKEELVTSLSDIIELSLRRKQFIEEYNKIKAKPLDFQRIEEKVEDPLAPKNIIKINTKSGETDVEIGTEYFLGRTVYKSKEGKDVYRMPRFTVLGIDEDGQLRIKDKSGEVRTISPDEFVSYKVAKVSDTLNNKKAKFFLEHWNTVYEFNFGKGKKVKGRLEYSPKEGVLTFVYNNKKGERKEIEVTGDQFVANTKKGFKQPMIKAIGELTVAQQKTLDEFTAEQDPRIIAKRESRLKILNDLFDEVSDRQNKTSKLIEQKTEQIAKIKQELEELSKEIDNAQINERVKKTVRFKTATKKALQNAMRLSRMQTQLEQEIEELTTINEDLDFNLSYISDMVENIDELPADGKEFLNELREQKNVLEDTILNTGIQINTLSKILKATQDALQSALDYVSDLITKFENKYPNVPRIMGQTWIDFLKQNPNFLKLQPSYRDELQDIDEQIAQVEDLDIVPGERTVGELTKDIDALYDLLKQSEKEIRAMDSVIVKFEEIAKKYKEQKVQEEQLQKNEQLLQEFLGSHDTGNVLNDFSNPNYEAASKKDELEVVGSTVAVSPRINPLTGQTEPVREHHARANRFGFKFNSLPNKDSMRGIVVTSKTEEQLGMPGLMDALFPGASKTELENIIALVIVQQNKNGKFSIVDENGEPLAEGADKINSAIYQVFPSSELTMNYGSGAETMFREGSENEKELREKYTQWRAEQLSNETLPAPESIRASFGIPEYVTYLDQDGKVHRDTHARVSVEDAGLITSEMLDEQALISVATTNESITNGSVTFRTPLGRVFLKVPGGLVKLFNRKFTSDEAGIIYDVIHRLTMNAAEDGTLKTERSQRLMKWLKSTTYWGIVKDQQGNRKDPGYSSIWFEEIVEDNVKATKLYMSGKKQGFEFSPSALENNKADILLLLENMYLNVNADLINDKSYLSSYEEITSILADGTPMIKKWPNYQTYLLSSEGRKPEELPLATQLVPIKGTENTNRKGIYFTRITSPEEFFIPQKVAPVIQEIPVVVATETKETSPVVQQAAPKKVVEGTPPPSPMNTQAAVEEKPPVTDGVTKNVMPMATGGEVIYTFNQAKAAELLSKEDPDTLSTPAKKMAFITKLMNDKILNLEYQSFVLQFYMDFSGREQALAESAIILGVFKRVMPTLVAETIPVAPPMGPAPVVETPPVVETASESVSQSSIHLTKQEGVDWNKATIAEIKSGLEDGRVGSITSNFEEPGETVTYSNFQEEDRQTQAMVGGFEDAAEVDIIDEPKGHYYLVENGFGESRTFHENDPALDKIIQGIIDYNKTPPAPTINTVTEEAPKKASSFKNRKRTENNDDKAYRLQVVKEAKKFQGEDWTKIESWLKANFPNLPVYRVKNMIQATNGRQAWGMLHNAAIYLYENAEVGTIYHEVFEGVWKTFATPEEKANINDEFRNRDGSFVDRFTGETITYRNATDAQIKEELAEQFRDKILSDQTSKGKSWIEKLFNDIINFLKTFFVGENAQKNTQLLFEKIGSGYYRTYIPYASKLAYASVGVQDIDNAAGDETSDFRIETIPAEQQHEIMQHMTFSVLRDIVKTNKSLFSVSEINLSRKDVYNQLQEDVLAVIGRQADILEEEIANGTITAKDAAFKYNNIEALYNNVIEEWDEITKKHLEQLASYNITFNEDDELALTDDEKGKEDPYGSPLKIDAFRKANSAVKLLLASLPYTDANGKFVPSSIGGAKLMPADEVYIMLKNKLFDSIGIDEMFERLADIARGNPNYTNLYHRLVKTSPSEDVDFENIDDQGLQLIASFFKAMKGQNPDAIAVFIQPSGEIIIGDSSLAGAARQAKREMMNSIISKIKGGLNYFIYDPKKGRYKSSEVVKNLKLNSGQLDSYVNFLKALDIHFDIRDLSTKLTDKQLGVFRKAVEGIKKSLSEVDGMVTISSNTLSIDGQLLKLGTIKAILENPSFESTYFSISGERSQTFIGTNAMSNLYDILSKAKNINDLKGTNYEYLITDVFSQGSVMLNKLFNIAKTGNRKEGTEEFMKPVYIDGTVNEVSGKKKQSSKLTERERIVQEINLNLDGIYMNLVPGDASLEWGAKMYDREAPFVSESEVVQKDYITIFKNYFISEVNLARDNRNVVGKNKSGDLRFLKSILGDTLHNSIMTKTNSKISAETLYDNYSKEIEKAVEEFIINEANSTQMLLRRYGIIKYTEEGLTVDELSFDNNTDITEEFLRTKLKTLSINYIIANIEYHKLVYSDPYQYKDELKRIKNFNSPRQPLLWGSKKINQAFNKLFNKGYSKEDIGFTDMDREYMRAITMEDVLSKYDVPGYENESLFEETDGGGYITLRANRVMGLRAGDWTAGNEQQYRYDIAYEKAVKGIPMSKLEKDILKGPNPNVKSTYTPRKPIVSGSKDSGRGYNDIVLDKYALVPLSFRILHEMNPDSNAIRLYNKMQREDVDYAVYASGRKVGAEVITPLYNEDGSFNERPFETELQANNPFALQSVTNIPFSIIGIQAEVPSKDSNDVTQGSQITKLATMDFMEAGVPIDFEKGIGVFEERFAKWIALTEKEKQSYNKGVNLYNEIQHNQQLLEARIEQGYTTLLTKLGLKQTSRGFELDDRTKLINTLRDEIIKREVNDNVSEAFYGFEKGDVVLEATPAYQQIRNILYSIADKNVIHPKITGGMKVQIPSTLLESVKAQPEMVNGKQAYTSDILKFYTNKDGERVCEIMVARWFKSNKSDEQLLNEWYDTDADGNKTLTEEGRKVLSGIGFRIPTQKQNSIDSFIIAKLLPRDFGDSVVIPSALVKKVGSDFDIDKLSIYLKNVFTGLNGKTSIVPYFGIGADAKAKIAEMYDKGNFLKPEQVKELNKELKLVRDGQYESRLIEAIFGEVGTFTEDDVISDFIAEANGTDVRTATIEMMYKKSLENEYIQSLQTLTSHELNFDRLVKPNSAEEMKILARTINRELGISEIDYSSTGNMLNRAFMTGLRQAFVSGKYAIGIAAVGQTNHAQNQRSVVFIDDDRMMDDTISDIDKRWLYDGQIKFKKYNSIFVNGKKRPTLSMVKNQAGEYISDIIGMFIDGYVDISKGPWIMQLGATPNVASTWLFLLKLGIAKEDVAFFMNQPIIRTYLNTLENAGYSWLFIDKYVDSITDMYAPEDDNITVRDIPDTNKLKSNISKNVSTMTDLEKAEQQFMLKEFLKYAKMASHLFDVTQGSNFDTATFNNQFLVFKKQQQLIKARRTIISSVDDILSHSFIGKVKNTLYNIRDAFATVLISDTINNNPGKVSVRQVMEATLLPFISTNDRDFVKIADKASLDLFDWAVQTDTKLNTKVASVLLGTATTKSVAEQITKYRDSIIGNEAAGIPAQSGHPLFNNMILNSIKTESGANKDKVDNVYLAGRDNKVYDQNLVIAAFRELKKELGVENKDLYGRLVRLAVIQSGLTNSKIAFTNLLPYEDFVAVYNKTLSTLENLPNLADFYLLGVFQRNNWNNTDIVPFMKEKMISYVDFRTGYMKIFKPNTESMHPKLKAAMEQNIIPKVVKVSKFSQEGNNDYIVFAWEEPVVITQEDKNAKVTTVKQKRALLRKNGDRSHQRKALMKKVYYTNDQGILTPLVIVDKKGKKEYHNFVYKAMNAWGDSFKAQEYYGKINPADPLSTLGAPSVLNNDFIKVMNEVENDVIVGVLNDDAIIQTANVSEKPENISQEEWDSLSQEEKEQIKKCE
jgi:hypothetical protein